MQIQETLQFVDEVVYQKTGKRLNDFQRGLIEGTLKYQKYSDIAKAYNRTERYAKDVGYKLLQMLSDVFDEPVNKGNLKSVLERQGNLNIYIDNKSINNFNNRQINCLSPVSEQINTTCNQNQPTTPKFNKGNKKKIQIETIDKLREFGLSDEQIAEVLKLPLEVVKQVES
ncbi:MAG: hypothetical protein WBB28_08170 [Crinalium sp.]